MKDTDVSEEGQALQPPPRLFERLAQLSGYTWDQSLQPFHSVGSLHCLAGLTLIYIVTDL